MADHSKPTLGSSYDDVFSGFSGRIDDAALGFDPAHTSPTNVPTYTVRWSSAAKKHQYWDGTTWKDLASEYAINISGAARTLKTARSFKISGGATAAAVNFDGSGNVELNVTDLDATKLSGDIAWERVSTNAPAQATRWPKFSEVTDQPSSYPPSAHNQDWDTIKNVPDASKSAKGIVQLAANAEALGRSEDSRVLTPQTLGFSLQPAITYPISFSKSDNRIYRSNIVSDLGLEVGDVIAVSGSSQNDNTYTVESIVDSGTIVVNYEHRNGAGSLSLANETGTTCTIKLLCKWYCAPIGLGQAWVDVSASRAGATTYTNTLPRAIEMSFHNQWNTTGGHYVDVTISGLGNMRFGAPATTSTTPKSCSGRFIIPHQGTYSVSSLSFMYELR